MPKDLFDEAEDDETDESEDDETISSDENVWSDSESESEI